MIGALDLIKTSKEFADSVLSMDWSFSVDGPVVFKAIISLRQFAYRYGLELDEIAIELKLQEYCFSVDYDFYGNAVDVCVVIEDIL